MPALGLLGGVSARALGFASSGAGGQAAAALFSFFTHTFTSGGAVGRFGPTITTLRNSYSLQPWAQNAQYFFQGRAQGYQVFQVPVDGIYEIEVAGARGQDGNSSSEHGRGAIVRARFTLSSSQKLEMVVGQVPGSSGQNPVSGASGGGGGSFVAFYQTNNPLIIAGGGGGRYSTATTQSVRNGQTRRQPRHTGYSYSPNSDGVQPPLGEGGSGYHAGGGGGFLTSGQPYSGRSLSDSAVGGDNVPPLYTHGSGFCGGGQLSGFYAIGGNWSGYNNVEGGFGGGGGGHSGNNTGGGGGGYSGGHGGQTSLGGSHNDGIGGGSYIDPSGTNVATSDGQYDGGGTFGGSAITNIGTFNDGAGYIKIDLIQASSGGGSPAEAIGEAVYQTPGTYSWTAPTGVSSVCVVCVGAGGTGDDGNSGDGGGGGGGGGALAYANFIPVTPGVSYTVTVGAGGSNGNGYNSRASDGGLSRFQVGSFIMTAAGGQGGASYPTDPGSTGGTLTFSNTPGGVVTGGGQGGGGGAGYDGGGGGGGAGGFTGAGGNGSGSISGRSFTSGFNGVGSGSGGGGGAAYGAGSGNGGGNGGSGQNDVTGGGGGGANIFITQPTINGGNGNGGTNYPSEGGAGGFPGGGGGGSWDNNTGIRAIGGNGAVRIIWGSNRSFPSTNVTQAASAGNVTTV